MKKEGIDTLNCIIVPVTTFRKCYLSSVCTCSQAEKYFYLANIKDDDAGKIRMVQLFHENGGAGFRFNGKNPFGDKSFQIVLAWVCSRGSLDISKEIPELDKTKDGDDKWILAHIHNIAMLCWKVGKPFCVPGDVRRMMSTECVAIYSMLIPGCDHMQGLRD